MARLSEAQIVDIYGPEVGPWNLSPPIRRHNIQPETADSMTLWAAVLIALALLIGAPVVSGALEHPHPAVDGVEATAS